MIHPIQVIELDPSCYKGYQRKHAALYGMGLHSEAFKAFSVMLSKLDQSPDPHIRGAPFYHYEHQQVLTV